MTEIDVTIEMFAEAEEGSQKLDEAFDWAVRRGGYLSKEAKYGWPNYRHPPAVSRNLQHAVEAVPSGWEWLARSAGSRGFANVMHNYQSRSIITRDGCVIDDSVGESLPVYAATAPLALCIAILKAHKAMTDERQTDLQSS